MSHRAAWLAWSLWAMPLSFVAGGLLLGVTNRPEAPLYEFWLTIALISPTFATLGALIVSRRPTNIIGWIFLLPGVGFGVQLVSGQYASVALLSSETLPAGALAAWLSTLAQLHRRLWAGEAVVRPLARGLRRPYQGNGRAGKIAEHAAPAGGAGGAARRGRDGAVGGHRRPIWRRNTRAPAESVGPLRHLQEGPERNSNLGPSSCPYSPKCLGGRGSRKLSVAYTAPLTRCSRTPEPSRALTSPQPPTGRWSTKT